MSEWRHRRRCCRAIRAKIAGRGAVEVGGGLDVVGAVDDVGPLVFVLDCDDDAGAASDSVASSVPQAVSINATAIGSMTTSCIQRTDREGAQILPRLYAGTTASDSESKRRRNKLGTHEGGAALRSSSIVVVRASSSSTARRASSRARGAPMQ